MDTLSLIVTAKRDEFTSELGPHDCAPEVKSGHGGRSSTDSEGSGHSGRSAVRSRRADGAKESGAEPETEARRINSLSQKARTGQ
jgi:hypothetical protein